jgi:hypothetical protein
MKLTDFRMLKKQVQRIGASPQEYEHRRLLEQGRVQLDVKGVVFGKEGIYWISSGGGLTKIIAHAYEWDIGKGVIPKNLKKLILDQNFSHPLVREHLPHYHLFTCDVLQRQLRRGVVNRVCATRRTDGKFFFRFLNNGEILVARDDFRLQMCPQCLRMLVGMGIGSDENGSKEFSLENYFCNNWQKRWVVGVYRPDDFSPPGIYPGDWRKIEEAYAAQVGFQCEQPRCETPNFSTPHLQKYLHCSYRPLGPDALDHWLLVAVCLRCFPELPGKDSIKEHKDYHALLHHAGV